MATLPALATSGKVSLAVTRDRTLALAIQKDAQTVQLFELDPLPARPTWKGYAAISGQLDGDLFAPGELFVPIFSSGAGRIVPISRATLRQKVGAANAGDQDKDGIVDALDDCPKVYDPVQQGCPKIDQAMLYASSLLTLADRVKVLGTNALAISSGTLTTTVGVDARIGSLQSRAPVSLKDRARATGSIMSGGAVLLGSGAGADGGISKNVALALDPLAFSITFPAAGAQVWLEPSQKRILPAGSFGSVNLKTTSVLFLNSGDYYFQSLTVEPGAQVGIDASQGPVRIYVKSSLIFRGNAAGPDGAPPKLILVYMGTTAAPIESSFEGTLVAPNAKVTLGSVAHYGAFYAKELEVQAGATLNFTTADTRWLPGDLSRPL